MAEFIELSDLAQQADSQVVVAADDLYSGIQLAIDRRQKRKTATGNLVAGIFATATAFSITFVAIQIYALDWQMASSCWPQISHHILFRELP